MAPKKTQQKAKGKKSLPAVPMPPKEASKDVQKDIVKPKPHIFEARPKNFRIGGDVLPKRDLSRFLRWPKYITLQRKKKILLGRLKVPPMINQFSFTLNKNQISQVAKLARKYTPESKQQKKERLVRAAKAAEAGSRVTEARPITLKYGLQQVTSLVENKRAELVMIAADVEPMELVLCLPTICRKKGVAYCIVKSQAVLGQMVGKKHTSCAAFTSVRKEDAAELKSLVETFTSMYNNNSDLRKKWGGLNKGVKHMHVMDKRQKALEAEAAKKAEILA